MLNRRLRASLVPITVALGLGACGDESSTLPAYGISGSYQLQTVGESGLPTLVYQNGVERWNVNGGNLELEPDGSFNESLTFAVSYSAAQPVVVTQTVDGSYQLSGEQIAFTSVKAGNWKGQITDEEVSYNIGGKRFRFRR